MIRYSVIGILSLFLTLSFIVPDEPDTTQVAKVEADPEMEILLNMEQKYIPQEKIKKRDYRKRDPIFEQYDKELDSLLGKDTTNYQ